MSSEPNATKPKRELTEEEQLAIQAALGPIIGPAMYDLGWSIGFACVVVPFRMIEANAVYQGVEGSVIEAGQLTVAFSPSLERALHQAVLASATLNVSDATKN